VATGLAAVGDDDVRPTVNRSPGLLDVHHLLHPQAANLMSLINKITWVAHVVGDQARTGPRRHDSSRRHGGHCGCTPYDDVTSGDGASESPPGQHIASQHRDPRLNGVAAWLAHSQVRGQ
jgi:hypothetical protein